MLKTVGQSDAIHAACLLLALSYVHKMLQVQTGLPDPQVPWMVPNYMQFGNMIILCQNHSATDQH